MHLYFRKEGTLHPGTWNSRPPQPARGNPKAKLSTRPNEGSGITYVSRIAGHNSGISLNPDVPTRIHVWPAGELKHEDKLLSSVSAMKPSPSSSKSSLLYVCDSTDSEPTQGNERGATPRENYVQEPRSAYRHTVEARFLLSRTQLRTITRAVNTDRRAKHRQYT